jgi:uncharacterized membrane protein YphA (DoxX/SURF4 family)
MSNSLADFKYYRWEKARNIAGLVACIVIGLTLVASGSGKLFAIGEVPGQTIEFLGFILPKALLTPWMVTFIYDIAIPFVLPAVELAIGLLLLIGFAPRLIAAIFIPLTFMLMGNNIYSIHIGMDKYPNCECFGLWEKIFGTLKPSQSLVFDIVLFVLAVVIIVVVPLGFFQSRKWLRNLGHKE